MSYPSHLRPYGVCLIGVAVATASVTEIAHAAPVSASIRLTAYRGGGANANNLGFPYIDLINTADSADIVDYRITIGDTGYFWDGTLINASSQISSANLTLLTPGSTLENESPSDREIRMTFGTGVFTPGTSLSHRSDIDADSQQGAEEVFTENQPDFRQVLFDLGGSDDADNARVTITFSDGQIVQQHLPDFLVSDENPGPVAQSTHNFGYITLDRVVPEPASAALLLAGALGFRRRRWRRASERLVCHPDRA